jgi:hypothetical protein
MRVSVLTAMQCVCYERERERGFQTAVDYYYCRCALVWVHFNKCERRGDPVSRRRGKVVAGIQKDAARVHNSALYIAP